MGQIIFKAAFVEAGKGVYQGYLCDQSRQTLQRVMRPPKQRTYLDALPSALFGASFFSLFEAKKSTLKQVEFTTNYPVRTAVLEAIDECERARQVLEVLRQIERMDSCAHSALATERSQQPPEEQDSELQAAKEEEEKPNAPSLLPTLQLGQAHMKPLRLSKVLAETRSQQRKKNSSLRVGRGKQPLPPVNKKPPHRLAGVPSISPLSTQGTPPTLKSPTTSVRLSLPSTSVTTPSALSTRSFQPPRPALDTSLHTIGALLSASHSASVSLCLSNPAIESMLDQLRRLSQRRSDIYGARVSAGGETLVVLCRQEAVETLRAHVRAYA